MMHDNSSKSEDLKSHDRAIELPERKFVCETKSKILNGFSKRKKTQKSCPTEASSMGAAAALIHESSLRPQMGLCVFVAK